MTVPRLMMIAFLYLFFSNSGTALPQRSMQVVWKNGNCHAGDLRPLVSRDCRRIPQAMQVGEENWWCWIMVVVMNSMPAVVVANWRIFVAKRHLIDTVAGAFIRWSASAMLRGYHGADQHEMMLADSPLNCQCLWS